MKKEYMVLLVIFAALILYGCSGGSDSGLVSEVDSSSSTIAGVDSDNDGVWDEEQEYIEINYGDDPVAKELLMNYAKVQQAFLLPENEEEAVTNFYTDNTMDCIFYLYPEDASEMIKDIGGLFTNTKKRVEAEMESSFHPNKEITALLSDEELEIICNQ